MPGAAGLLPPVLIFLIKMYFRRGRVYELKRIHSVLVLLLIAGASYLIPFLQKNETGFYSRGGGDHSTYLTLSEWFVSHSLWETGKADQVNPPKVRWELNRFLDDRKGFIADFPSKNLQPLANQMISTPYMAVFSGYSEETYTASVAFYLSISALSYILFFSSFFHLTGFSVYAIGTALSLSSMLMYVATCHSIPFLYSIALFNYLIYFSLSVGFTADTEWKRYFGAVLTGGCLLMIYPHLWILFLFLLLPVYFFSAERLPLVYIIKKLAIFAIGSILLANVFLFINIPLVLFSSRSVASFQADMTVLQILSLLFGYIDPGIILYSVITAAHYKAFLLISSLSVAAAVYALFKSGRNRRTALTVFLSLTILITVYYTYKNLTYQAVRFAELVHGYLLALSALGFSVLSSSEKKVKYIGWTGSILMLLALLYSRFFIISEGFAPEKNFQTDFKGRNFLQVSEKAASLQAEHNRTVYYFGTGYGVDSAGASVLLRNSGYFNASGLDYGSMTGGRQIWEKEYAENAVLLDSADLKDIIQDLRPSSEKKTVYPSITETSKTNAVRFLGHSWNIPQEYNAGSSKKYFRYLRFMPGAIVLWNQQEETLKLRMTVHTDSESAVLKTEDGNSSPLFFKISKWSGEISEKNRIEFSVRLKKGSNSVVFTPISDSGKTPWILFWDLSIEN
ncbi:MAG TPA: hypothetical protein PK453_20740 [Leptospiraceae bacterium]|nr:hypothetical protein [Leptospiraceae bacterium]HMY68444.1 hypothetical protein [Leptospiraceae bacterium]HNF16101.1 hypothetical protein [Leptospiraceae bacterium]HNI96597.1 hypothetical protein [Leptospiraceae bacterium]